MSAAALAPWNGSIVSVADIAVYATLCALATLGRSELKARVVETEGLAGDGDGMKELLDAWMASNFRAVLGLLDKYSVSVQFGYMLSFYPFSPDHNCSGPGSLFARSPTRPTRRESHGAHPLPRSRALFPTVRDDPARAHEHSVRLDGGRHGKGGRVAHPAGGHPRSRRQPKQNFTGALYESPRAAVCTCAEGWR